ncbi:MAG: phosphate ABC transporter substrate-binding protein PstS [Beijerinckiaceae bacterium]|nr:phosphate ABC transporter substrate-binding protein PstS [Beijerinckiaceae bacterium]
MHLRTIFRSALVAGMTLAAGVSAGAQDITGAGATFPFPIYAKWADAYKKETGIGLNYQSIGSGAGVKQILAKTVVFGATDAPLQAAMLEKEGLVQWPQVMGALVAIVNVDGVKQGEMVFDGPTLADIYLGKIKTWDDPAIVKLNPNLKLPKAAISVVRRSDGSGTTFVWTNYLSEVSDEWKSKVGVGTAVEWPTGVGARGNEGVAGNVGQTRNSIGYVEFAYAKQANLSYTLLKNKAGQVLRPNKEVFQAAAANADWEKAPGYRIILTNQAGEKSWPITAATFILMHKKPQDAAQARRALDFFTWAFEKGDGMAEELDFIPMPDPVVKLIKQTWAKDIQAK